MLTREDAGHRRAERPPLSAEDQGHRTQSGEPRKAEGPPREGGWRDSATLTLGTWTLMSIRMTKVFGGRHPRRCPFDMGPPSPASAGSPSARASNRFTDTVRAPGAEPLFRHTLPPAAADDVRKLAPE